MLEPGRYGNDRIFAYVRLKSTADAIQDAKVAALEAAGHPVVHLQRFHEDLYEIFGQFFTWEIATAVAGSVMDINPFNQPDVESAKIETRALTTSYEKTGKLPERAPVLVDKGIQIYATEAYAAKLKAAAPAGTLAGYLRAHIGQIKAGDYFASLAFLPMFAEHEEVIQGFRHKVSRREARCNVPGIRAAFSSFGQDRTIKVDPIPGSFCRSQQTTRLMLRFQTRNTVLESL